MEYPSHNNREKLFIVLVDVLPDIGPMDGYFDFRFDGRTINGKLFDKFEDAAAFLIKASSAIKPVIDSAGMVGYQQVSAVLIDRLGEGTLIDANELKKAAINVYMRKIMERRTRFQPGDFVERSSKEAMRRADRMVSKIAPQLRGRVSLLRYKDPIHALNMSPYHWRVPFTTLDQVYEIGDMQVYKEYIDDPTISKILRDNIWQMSWYIKHSMERVIPVIQARLSAQYTNRMEKYNDPKRSFGGLRIIDRAIRLFNAAGARRALVAVMRNRVNFMDEISLDTFMLSWISNNLTLDNAMQSIFEADDMFKPNYIEDKKFPAIRRQTQIQLMRDTNPGDAPTPVNLNSPLYNQIKTS